MNPIYRYWQKYSPLEVLTAHLIFLIPLGLVFVVSFSFHPEDFEHRRGLLAYTPKCTYRQITDKPCFTCGLSRAFAAISHGEFHQAMTYNKLAYLWYGGFAISTVLLSISLLAYFLGKNNHQKQREKKR